MKIRDNLIGHHDNNTIAEYFSGDTKEKYERMLNIVGPSWYYKNKTITYNINFHGHRSKEITELNFDNYILFLGCSITEGMGLESDKIYTHLLSNRLNKDYYNLSVGGTGIDCIYNNLCVWLNKFKKPKLIVVQIPDRSRFFIEKDTNLIPIGTWDKDKNNTDFIVQGELIDYFATKQYLLANLLNSLDIPTISVTITNYNLHNYNFPNLTFFNLLDTARDGNPHIIGSGHPGVMSHYKVSDDCYKLVKSNWSL